MVEYFIINLNVIEKIFHKICSKRRFMGIHVSNIVPRWLKELLRMCKTISTFKSIKLLQHCATKLLNCIHFSPKWHLIVAALCERREHKNFKNCYKSCAYIFSSSSIFFLIQSSAKHTNRLANRGLCVTNLLSLSTLIIKTRSHQKISGKQFTYFKSLCSWQSSFRHFYENSIFH